MLSCYIIDDEEHSIEVLKKYINRTPELELTGFETDALKGLAEIHERRPDITFLDIDMPHLKGMDLAKIVSGMTNVVFATASAAHAVEAYTRNIHDYLLKPISYERFLICISKIKELKRVNSTVGEKKDYFFIIADSRMIKIDFDDVYYIESLNNYIIVYHNNEKHITYITLKEIEKSLPEHHFSRVHKSFIVNNNKVKSIEGNQIIINNKNKTVINIGHSYKEQFFTAINRKLIKKPLKA